MTRLNVTPQIITRPSRQHLRTRPLHLAIPATGTMPQIDKYKLETTVLDGSVIHTTYKTDLESRQRRTVVQTKWTDKKKLGSGGFGIVVLQEAEGGKVRAVKKLLKGMANIDYSRELTVLSKVAHVSFPNRGPGVRLTGYINSASRSLCLISRLV